MIFHFESSICDLALPGFLMHQSVAHLHAVKTKEKEGNASEPCSLTARHCSSSKGQPRVWCQGSDKAREVDTDPYAHDSGLFPDAPTSSTLT